MKKILFLSHNSILSSTNMGITARKLLSSFENQEICQINIRECELSNTELSTLVINERDVLKSILTRGDYWYEPNENTKEKNQPSKYVESTRNSFKLLLRSLVWLLGNKYTNKLDMWMKINKPVSIFIMPGDSTFIYSLAIKLSRKYNIRIITFLGDDYSGGINSKSNFFDLIYGKLLIKSIRDLINESSRVFCISESMSEHYESLFGKLCDVVMPSFDNRILIKPNFNDSLNLVYAGSFSVGRLSTLVKISNTIMDLIKGGYEINFQIFGPKLDVPEFYNSAFSKFYMGLLTEDQLKDKIQEANCLLHVESFDPSLFNTLRHSFSTKLSNYLVSNRLIFCVGPEGLNSIDYIKNNHAGVVVNSLDEVEDSLVNILENWEVHSMTALRSYKLGLKNHNPKDVGKEIRRVLLEVSND